MAKRHKRGAKGYRGRRINTRDIRQRFFIVCEGEKTEPAYFESFRAPHVVIRVQDGSSDPLRLVEEATDRMRRERAADPRPRGWDKWNQVWCVFDRDDVAPERFRQALETAEARGIRVAYSNPCIELWFLLHYEAGGGGKNRPDYRRRLSRLLERPYKKNDPRLHEALAARQAEAIARAERLLATYDPPNPVDDDPSTTIHELVKALLHFSSE